MRIFFASQSFYPSIGGINIFRVPKHNDPFDRMLVNIANANKFTLVTPDKLITQYPIKTLWQVCYNASIQRQ